MKLSYVSMYVIPHHNNPLIDCFQKASTATQSDVPAPNITELDLDHLPREIKGHILKHLPYEHIFHLKSVSKTWKRFIDELLPTLSLRETPTLTACYFFIEIENYLSCWQWAGFDPKLRKWRRLPSLMAFLPPNCSPDVDLFKEFLLCTKAGLVCMNFSKSLDKERLIVFNPLSGHWKELPPLIQRRNPVLMHMLVDPSGYQILVAGSCRSGDAGSSKLTELYDSRSGEWETVSPIPGPPFALNEYQSGVYQTGNILCNAFVELNHDDSHEVTKGILGFNVKERRWWTHALPSCVTSNSTILQLMESHGQVYLFSERENIPGENGQRGSTISIEHCVYRLEWMDTIIKEVGAADDEVQMKRSSNLVTVVKKRKRGGRSLEVYPEFVLVPYSECELCVYNTVDHSGEVYDVGADQLGEWKTLPALPESGFRGEMGFFSLNAMSFMVEPRFSAQV